MIGWETGVIFREPLTIITADDLVKYAIYAKKVETSGIVLYLLRIYVIGNWNSEPHQQNQNHAEGKYIIIKQITNCIMERSGSPAYC